ncbi:MAG TPA: Ig-like domain-containing protein, partial [Burkholderiaceae bacterium]
MPHETNQIRRAWHRWVGLIAAGGIAAIVAGCGGDGGLLPGTGSGGTTSGNPTVTVTVVEQSSGVVTNTISSTTQSVVRAVVKDGTGKAVENAVVSFGSSGGDAVVFTPAATALTDSNGRASVNVGPASFSTAGAYTLTASAVVGTQSAQGTFNVAIGATQIGLGALTAGVSPLSAYGTTVMSVPITGVSGSTQVAVRFTSTCAAQTPPRATITSLVTSVNGVARATYVDMGCGGTDLVTATVEGTSVSALANLVVANPAISNIQFVSASPTVISLRGVGGVQGPGSGVVFPEISTVRFRVVDQAGVAIPSPINVTLQLSNDTGGILIDGVAGPVTKQTNAQGEVEVQVQAGTIPTPVWVIATIVNGSTTLTTNSVQLAVSTGQPIQSRFSFSAQPYNIEGWSYVGEASDITIIAADSMGNPVPDGTAISFITEAGLVEANCQTGVANPNRPLPGGQNRVAGICAVQLLSQGVRPTNGRLRVAAYAVGEEHFDDLNSNNRYDAGEPFFDQGYLFLDRNENGSYQSPERVIPYLTAQSGACGANPLTASVPNTCDGVWGRAHVRQQATFVFSGSFGFFRTSPGINLPNSDNIATSYSLGPSCSAQVSFWLQDLNGNPMPFDTTVKLDVSAGLNLKLVPNEEQKVPNT